jgi:rare lipoprotein A (peptidoglycan hydrolase)
VKGTATFSSLISSPVSCQAANLPFNSTLTVTNLDNSRSVQCVASIGGLASDDTVVLSAEAFATIADITDAPVPVQIIWTAA